MFWIRCPGAMASPPSRTGMLPRIVLFDGHGIGQLVCVAGAGRKRLRERVSEQFHGRDETRGPVATLEVGGHSLDDGSPEVGRDLRVDPDVADHGDLAAAGRDEDQDAVACPRRRNTDSPERALRRGAGVAPEPRPGDRNPAFAGGALLGGADRLLDRVEIDPVRDALGGRYLPPDAPPPPELPPPP